MHAPNGRLKIGDFGFAKRTADNLTTTCGTLEYVAPEILGKDGHGYGPQCDVWSLGVACYIMLSGTRPYWDENTTKLLKMIANPKQRHHFRGRAWDGRSLLARSFVDRCLEKDPAKRATMSQLLEDDWLQGLKPVRSGALPPPPHFHLVSLSVCLSTRLCRSQK